MIPIAIVILSIAVVGFATGLTIPLVSLRMYAQQHEPFVIGMMAAAPALGIIVAAPLVRYLVAALGRKRLLLVCFVVSAGSIMLLEYVSSLMYMFPLRLAMGAAAGLIIALGEAWINELTGEATRGRIVALYATTFTVSQLTGPAIVSLLGAQSTAPILISTAMHAAAAALLFFIGTTSFSDAEKNPGFSSLSIAGFICQAPELGAAVLFFSFFDSAVLSLFPVYGMEHGYPVAAAAFMVSVILGGDAMFQMPIGWLADKMGRAALHRLCGALTFALSILLPLTVDLTYLLYPLLASLGAAAGGIYTLALIRIGQAYRGNDLVTANAAAGMIWGIGSLAGPLVAGAATAAGAHGLPITLATGAGIFLASTFWSAPRLAGTRSKP